MPGAKADLVKRFLAALIDGLIAGAIAYVFGWFGTAMGGIGTLIGGGYILVRDGLNSEYADGRSVGKKIIGLRPVRLDGGPMTIDVSVRRNWTLALVSIVSGVGSVLMGLGPLALLGLPIVLLSGLFALLNLAEGILVIVDADGRRIGDKTGGTQVIEEATVAAAA